MEQLNKNLSYSNIKWLFLSLTIFSFLYYLKKNNFYINLLCEAQKRAPPGCRQILSPGLKWARLPAQAPSVCIWPCLSGPQSPNVT